MYHHDGNQKLNQFSRRRFITITGITALGTPLSALANFKANSICLVADTNDPVARSASSQWAVKALQASLISKGITVKRKERLAEAGNEDLCIVIAGTSSSIAKKLLKESTTVIPDLTEALGLIRLKSDGKPVLLATANDERGLTYAVLELADRVNYAVDPLASLDFPKPVVEKPANSLRSLTRLFVSEVEDKPWFNDKEMWPEYLTMLATQRFNRFNLALGIGYDFLRNVTDAYFLFAYPFLLSVPGYDVKAKGLPDAERDSNLRMLQFISEQTVARGMQFQLGLWMHGYEWLDSPKPNYTIEGITKENHGAYCRDAVRALLKACPAISGITFRVHGESGVNEGSYAFWKMVFEGVATCGRIVEIDMHSKGMDQTMIDAAVASGMPVVISPKYWAEHMGMPYHQADIRELEIPKPEKRTSVLMNLSEGSRSFLRYGYGDLLKEDRPYKVIHRIWPGTQRLLLWGDPLTAAAHSKAFSFSGSAGVEIMEPLSFKGRRGSGIAGDRCGYLDSSLKPRWDWEKYLYTLRVFGRLQYNPDSHPDVWQRFLRNQFGAGAAAAELALANATRILPIVLTAHGTSAGNNTYWPEIYTNHPIADPNIKHPYSDSPAPKLFGNVSPLDPQLFLRINDFAAELLKGERSGKYTPVEAAQWIEDYADAAATYLQQAEAKTVSRKKPEFRRMAQDVSIQVALGRFFGAKFRAGVLYGIFEQSGDPRALQEALKAYRRAHTYWSGLANAAKGLYKNDITVGEREHLRGHWLDRLPAMEADIAFMAKKLEQASSSVHRQDRVTSAVQEALGRPKRMRVACQHRCPEKFTAGQSLHLEITPEKKPESIRLFYRHINQGERYQTADMQGEGKSFMATIPADYTNSKFPLQYYFELRQDSASASLYPGFNKELANQPYFIVRQA